MSKKEFKTKWDDRATDYLLDYYGTSSLNQLIRAYREMGYEFNQYSICKKLKELHISKSDYELMYNGKIKKELPKKNIFKLCDGFWVKTNKTREEVMNKYHSKIKHKNKLNIKVI